MAFGNDLVTNREPEAGAFADGFGGEERIEQFGAMIFGNAGAVVANADEDFTAEVFSGDGDLGRSRFVGAAPGGDFLLQGVGTVAQQIHQHLIELTGIALDERQIGVLFDDFDRGAIGLSFESVLQNQQRTVNAFVQIDGFFLSFI